MRITSRKARMGAPLTIGDIIVFQKFGVDRYDVDVLDATKELKKSEDFTGYSSGGEYSSASYTANTYQDDEGDHVFKGKECFEVVFEDTDDVSFL